MARIPSHIVTNVATLGPLGYAKVAPGTVGTLAGIVWYTIVFYSLNPISFVLLFLLSVGFAIAFCGEAEVRLLKTDPSEVILDEFVAVPLCYLGMGSVFQHYPVGLVIVMGFFLFRFFDVVKPLGINRLQKLKGGLGVVLDDLAAALATSLSLHILFFLWEHYR